MEVVSSIAGVRGWVAAARARGQRVGLVPTMGYLHDGHAALIRRAAAMSGAVVVSVFVNPLQFGPNEDYDRYPRDLERDQAIAQAAGAHCLFTPAVAEMYPSPVLTNVTVSKVSEGLCGAHRPGHFAGVATVVAKLLNIVSPDLACFGRKDAQQLAVVRRMVDDLNLPVTIVPVDIVREPDGLAMSSRNAYLTPPQRRAALALHRALRAGAAAAAAGERSAAALIGVMDATLAAEPLVAPEYTAVVHPDTMAPLASVAGPALLALAARVGATRLIDNWLLNHGDC